jgi:hypothetical protein
VQQFSLRGFALKGRLPHRTGLVVALLFLAVTSVTASWAEPVRSQFGIYLTRLDDFNIRAKTFNATFWLFTVAGKPMDPTLTSLEFTNAVSISVTNRLEEQIGGRYWLQERIQGTFRHNWDLSHYPFTKQALHIEVEATDDMSEVLLDPDHANTGFDRDIRIDGWRITSVRLLPVVKEYRSSFGDPRLEPGSASQYSRLTLVISVEQVDLSSFITMVITPVIALLITLITYLLFSKDLGLLTARFSLLVGSIFAVVISMRSVATELGSMTGINMLEIIHVAALIYVTIGIAAAVHTWLALRKDGDVAHTRSVSNWIAVISTAALFSVISLAVTDAYLNWINTHAETPS